MKQTIAQLRAENNLRRQIKLAALPGPWQATGFCSISLERCEWIDLLAPTANDLPKLALVEGAQVTRDRKQDADYQVKYDAAERAQTPGRLKTYTLPQTFSALHTSDSSRRPGVPTAARPTAKKTWPCGPPMPSSSRMPATIQSRTRWTRCSTKWNACEST